MACQFPLVSETGESDAGLTPNETAKESQSFGYVAANRLTSANTGSNTATYTYNGEGARR